MEPQGSSSVPQGSSVVPRHRGVLSIVHSDEMIVFWSPVIVGHQRGTQRGTQRGNHRQSPAASPRAEEGVLGHYSMQSGGSLACNHLQPAREQWKECLGTLRMAAMKLPLAGRAWRSMQHSRRRRFRLGTVQSCERTSCERTSAASSAASASSSITTTTSASATAAATGGSVDGGIDGSAEGSR